MAPNAPRSPAFDGQTLVEKALAHGPGVAPVFLRHGMACPGCAMAPFMTLAEAAKSYGVDLQQLLADLAEVAGRP